MDDLSFSHCHCSQCLTQKHATGTSYLHPVLEAKLLSPTGLALSLASEFIENPPGRTPTNYQEQKQDCELKAFDFDRLARTLKASFPQLRLCLSFDGLYACGRTFAIGQKHHWHFVVTFKEGRLPDLWKEFQALLQLQPEQKLTTTLPDKTRRVYRWGEQLPYTDSQKRSWTLGAILCEETSSTGEKTTFAWLTNLAVSRDSVMTIADQVGRLRTQIENEGFNVQKNSGLNLEHVYSQNWDHAKAYYYLLQIGHLLMQLLHHNSLHRALAKQYGRHSVLALWGALKKNPPALIGSAPLLSAGRGRLRRANRSPLPHRLEQFLRQRPKAGPGSSRCQRPLDLVRSSPPQLCPIFPNLASRLAQFVPGNVQGPVFHGAAWMRWCLTVSANKPIFSPWVVAVAQLG